MNVRSLGRAALYLCVLAPAIASGQNFAFFADAYVNHQSDSISITDLPEGHLVLDDGTGRSESRGNIAWGVNKLYSRADSLVANDPARNAESTCHAAWYDTVTINDPARTGQNGSFTVSVRLDGSIALNKPAAWNNDPGAAVSVRWDAEVSTASGEEGVPNVFGFWSGEQYLGEGSTGAYEGNPLNAVYTSDPVPFVFGEPFQLSLILRATTNIFNPNQVQGIASSLLDMSHSAYWQGMQVRTDNGQVITGATVSSRSGTNWLEPVRTLSSFNVSPTHVAGGQKAIGEVSISANAPAGGAQMSVADNSSALTTPASVTIPANSSVGTFNIGTGAVAATSVRQVQVTYAGKTLSANVTLTPSLQKVTVSPSVVQAGKSTTGTVFIFAPAPAGGYSVSLSDNSSALSTPTSVTIPAGATSASFSITTAKVTSAATRQVIANLGHDRSASITLKPLFSALSLQSTTVQGGNGTTGTVSLNFAAPAGGTVVTLTDNSSAISVPASVTVPAGQTAVGFNVNTVKVSSQATRQISATCDGTTKTVNLTLTP